MGIFDRLFVDFMETDYVNQLFVSKFQKTENIATRSVKIIPDPDVQH